MNTYNIDKMYENYSSEIEKMQKCIDELQQENQKLKKQLEYLRSGEYYNQLRFENEMLQQVVDTNGVPSEVYDYIDCTHRNTELLEENQELKKQLEDKDKKNHECLIFYEKIASKNEQLENQQKEFIEYLEKKIKRLEKSNNEFDRYEKLSLKEILSKYKEIIGVSNEKDNN